MANIGMHSKEDTICFDLISSTIGNNKKSGWDDNNEAIVQEQEVQYELLDVEDEKFYRGNWMVWNLGNQFKFVYISIVFIKWSFF